MVPALSIWGRKRRNDLHQSDYCSVWMDAATQEQFHSILEQHCTSQRHLFALQCSHPLVLKSLQQTNRRYFLFSPFYKIARPLCNVDYRYCGGSASHPTFAVSVSSSAIICLYNIWLFYVILARKKTSQKMKETTKPNECINCFYY